MTEQLYRVRFYDGFDNIWMDVSKPVPLEEAERLWREYTDDGKVKASFDDIDYYRIFPADTVMHFSSEGYAARGEVPPR